MRNFEERIESLTPEKQRLLARKLRTLNNGDSAVGTAPADGLRLVAYLSSATGEEIDPAELRSYLAGRLPSYMIPNQYVFLESLPQTPNGKVDRQALPNPDVVHIQKKEPAALPRNAVEEDITRLWSELLDFGEIEVHDNFFDLGGHSLLVMRMIAQLRSRYQIEIPVSLFFQDPTVAGLANQIQRLRAAAQPAVPTHNGVKKTAAVPAHEGSSNGKTEVQKAPDHQWVFERSWESLVPIQVRGSRPPFFGIHAITGQILFWRHLVKYLDDDQPFYGVQARGLDGLQAPRTSIPEMATAYLKEIKAVQPKGPYHLGGYSLGGEIAFEMAQQLATAGEEVALLVLFDTSNPIRVIRKAADPGQTPVAEKLPRRSWVMYHKVMNHLERLSELSWREKWQYLAKDASMRARRLRVRLLVRSYWAQKKRLPEWLVDAYVDQCHMQAVMDYAPVFYPGRIVLFRAQQSLAMSPLDDPLGWKPLAKELELHLFDSNHEIVNAAYAKEVAEKLQECLQNVQS
jgi:thioesterase domain-containing protein/acyl carrier protein